MRQVNAVNGSKMVVKLWGFYYRRVNGMKLNKLDLCLFPTAVYKFIDTISDYCTSSIKDQIIDISCSGTKRQLYQFYA